MVELKERLAEALNIRDMKPIELAEKTGIARGTISHYLSGTMVPKSRRIYVLAKALRVQPAWLIGYDVPMEDNAPEESERQSKMSEIERLFNLLEPESQTVILKIVRSLAEKDLALKEAEE